MAPIAASPQASSTESAPIWQPPHSDVDKPTTTDDSNNNDNEEEQSSSSSDGSHPRRSVRLEGEHVVTRGVRTEFTATTAGGTSLIGRATSEGASLVATRDGEVLASSSAEGVGARVRGAVEVEETPMTQKRKRDKGKEAASAPRSVQIPRVVLALDLETTGAGRTARITEIGAVVVNVDENGASLDDREPFSTFVKPTGKYTLPAKNSKANVSGIIEDDLIDAPSFSDALDLLVSYVGNGQQVALLTHNGLASDLPRLFYECALAKVEFPGFIVSIMDTFKASKNVPSVDNVSLSGSRRDLSTLALLVTGAKLTNAHRAADDAQATARVAIHSGFWPHVVQTLVSIETRHKSFINNKSYQRLFFEACVDLPRLGTTEVVRQPADADVLELIEFCETPVDRQAEDESTTYLDALRDGWNILDEEPVARSRDTTVSRYKGPVVEHSDRNKSAKYTQEDDKFVLRFFLEQFREEIVDLLLEQSNLYASQVNDEFQEIKGHEIYLWLAIRIGLGTIGRWKNIKSIWSKNTIWYNFYIARLMPRERFRFIDRHIHLADNESMPENNTDSLYKVRPLVHIVQRIVRERLPTGRDISADESSVACNHRTSVSTSQNHKPGLHKFGVCVYNCADAQTGHLLNFEISSKRLDEDARAYLSDNEICSVATANAIGATTAKLAYVCARLRGNYHTVYADRHYVSPECLVFFSRMNIDVCGTVQRARRGIPKAADFSLPKGAPKYSSKFAVLKDEARRIVLPGESLADVPPVNLVLSLWDDRSHVLLLSSFRCDDQDRKIVPQALRFNHTTMRKEPVPRPLVVGLFNAKMGAVDEHNKFWTQYRLNIKGQKRWWVPLMMYQFDALIVNAFLDFRLSFHSKHKHFKMDHSKYRTMLVDQLIEHARDLAMRAEPAAKQRREEIDEGEADECNDTAERSVHHRQEVRHKLSKYHRVQSIGKQPGRGRNRTSQAFDKSRQARLACARPYCKSKTPWICLACSRGYCVDCFFAVSEHK